MEKKLEDLQHLLETHKWDSADPAAKAQVLSFYKQYAQYGSMSRQLFIAQLIRQKFYLSHEFFEKVLAMDEPQAAGFLSAHAMLPPSVTLFPGEGWLRYYLNYTNGNEAPDVFHFWVSVCILGTVLKRNVWFDKGYYKVYPNHFVVLIAPSGRCRKSSATNIGVNLLRKVPSVNVIAEKITPEALVSALSRTTVDGTKVKEEAAGLIHAPELAVFLGRQQYNEGLIAILTTLSDSPDSWVYQTRHAGTVKLTGVSLNLLGASTPDWLADSLPESAFGGGFMSRILFVVRESTDRMFPFPQVQDPRIHDYLVEKLTTFSQLKGKFELDDAGRRWYTHWYSENRQLRIEDLRLSGYYERKPDHLLKLAMVLAVADEQGLVLTERLFVQAASIIQQLEATMPSAFAVVEATTIGRDQARIVKHIERAGGTMSHTSLLRVNCRYLNAWQFGQAIRTLTEAGLILEVKTRTGHTYTLVHEPDTQ